MRNLTLINKLTTFSFFFCLFLDCFAFFCLVLRVVSPHMHNSIIIKAKSVYCSHLSNARRFTLSKKHENKINTITRVIVN